MTSLDALGFPDVVLEPETSLDYALDYAARGWRVVPVRPGANHPAGIMEWQNVATTDAATIRGWWTGPYQGYGICVATGELADGTFLVVIDVDDKNGKNGSESLRDLEEKYGPLPATPTVHSPSGGRHFYFRSPVKVGNDQSGKVGSGIDVRGVGGQAKAPPTVHKNGGSYVWDVEHGQDMPLADIPDWLLALAAPAPKPTSTPRSTVWDGFDDSPAGRFNAGTTWPELLEPDGWRLDHVRDGVDYWTRPGKDDGTSATVGVHGKDILHVFTSSVPFLDVEGNYSRFKYYAARHHDGDTSAAARAILADPRFYPVFTIPDDVDEYVEDTIDDEPQETEKPTAPEPEPKRHKLPESFWTSRPVFKHIRQAAQAGRVGPEALLGHVLARVAAYTPPAYCVPAFVGGVKPLTLYVAQVAESGGGKSSPAGVVDDLIPDMPVGVDCLVLGSGEGVAASYLELVKEKNGDGRTATVLKQTRYGLHFELDEGKTLQDMTERKGVTIISALNTVWTGGKMGAALKDPKERRRIEGKNYTAGVVLLFQPDNARVLFNYKTTGFPQRFLFVESPDYEAPEKRPPFPGALPWTPPPSIAIEGRVQHHPLNCHPDIEAEVDARYLKRLRREVKVDPLDAHRDLHRLKVAGLFTILDNRRGITVDDWNLAGQLLDYSDAVRSAVLSDIVKTDRAREKAANKKAADRVVAAEITTAQLAQEAIVRAIARKVEKLHPEPAKRRDLQQAIAGKYRQFLTLDDAVDMAVTRKLIARNSDGDYIKGKKT